MDTLDDNGVIQSQTYIIQDITVIRDVRIIDLCNTWNVSQNELRCSNMTPSGTINRRTQCGQYHSALVHK